jgi:hypothetical protein
METIERKEQWPVIDHSEVADICRKICESILELELAFEAGNLSSRLTPAFERILGPQLYESYKNLTKIVPGSLHHLRVDAIRAMLAQLQNDLLPTQVAGARVCRPPEGDPPATETEAKPRPTSRFKLVDASFDGASSTTLRLDQMLDVRFWRIGFTFESRELCDAFAQTIVRTATRRLASELLSLQRILERFGQRALKRELRIVSYPRQKRFEHLMLDILNEEQHHARVAPLFEDFLEKTDLRVQYPELKRRQGARVQVTSITAPEQHDTKLRAIKLAEEFVFLSPLTLAEYAALPRGHTSVIETSGMAPFALDLLWDCLGAKPANVPELASELKRILFDALAKMPDSPLGPIVRVPAPIRRLIALFVKTQAIGSTSRLRQREKIYSRIPESNENDSDDDCDRCEKTAEFLRGLNAGDRIRGRVRNIVDYGAFIDLGYLDGLLHISGIPGAVNGMVGEKLTKGEDIEVQVVEIDLAKPRVSLRIPID